VFFIFNAWEKRDLCLEPSLSFFCKRKKKGDRPLRDRREKRFRKIKREEGVSFNYVEQGKSTARFLTGKELPFLPFRFKTEDGGRC